MDNKLSIEATILLALDALQFKAGDWKQESIERHLKEQVALAESRLLSLIDESKQQCLVFSDWKAGHHGLCPDPIPVIDSAHAKTILEAMSNCVIQGQSFRAKLADPHTDLAFWYIGEDFINDDDGYHWEQASITAGWKGKE